MKYQAVLDRVFKDGSYDQNIEEGKQYDTFYEAVSEYEQFAHTAANENAAHKYLNKRLVAVVLEVNDEE